MRAHLRVAVLGEGKDERGKDRTLSPLDPVPHKQQGAMEILVRRALYPLLNDGQPWHRGLVDNDGIQILQPPAGRLPRQPSMVPLLQPVPEIQAWLARKRAIELVYGREHCSVPEPDEEALKRDAKTELLRLLRTFGGKFDAKMQARLAETVSVEDLNRYDWTGWERATEELKTALASRAGRET